MFLSPIVLLTRNGQFLDSVSIAFGKRYVMFANNRAYLKRYGGGVK